MAIAGLVLLLVLVFGKKKPLRVEGILIPTFRNILEREVEFYRKLNANQKKQFETRMQGFLDSTRITGIKTEVEDLDRVLIAAGAIIPIFAFPDWEYINLNEVLLYPGAFNHDFQQEGRDRHIAGMVEGKQGWLLTVARADYPKRMHDSVRVELHPGLAIVKGKMDIEKNNKGKKDSYHLRYIRVYNWRQTRWELVSHTTTHEWHDPL